MNQSPALKTEWSDEFKCFVAHTGERDIYDSRWVGEGSTPEDARSDYWSQANSTVPTARLYEDVGGEFFLYDGRTSIRFENKLAAITYADARNWII